jgi:uncharacterized membrane protein
MKGYWVVYLGFLLVLASAVHAAVIHGNVYDLELNTLSQAVVDIDTMPKQVMVSRNGTYQFTVAPGKYIITARHAKLDLLAREQIMVKAEGSYVFDLILFPNLEAEEELLNETVEVEGYDEPEPVPWLAIGLLVLLVLAGLGWWYWKKRAPPAKEEKKVSAKADLEEILAFVRKEGGRTTQKDLRRAIPYSEAKISLMIAELEAQGKLKKIKKGRGNIIILP